MIEVFHWVPRQPYHRNAYFGFMIKKAQAEAIWKKEPTEALCYKKAADVRTDDLEEAFALTNHVDTDWTEGARVTAVGQGCRSTSTGDVMKMSDGSLHLVSSFGFTKLDV